VDVHALLILEIISNSHVTLAVFIVMLIRFGNRHFELPASNLFYHTITTIISTYYEIYIYSLLTEY